MTENQQAPASPPRQAGVDRVTELPAMANGLSDGSPVHDDELGEIRRERLLASIRDRWTGNRALDLRNVPIEHLEEAELEHDRESARRYDRADREQRMGLRWP